MYFVNGQRQITRSCAITSRSFGSWPCAGFWACIAAGITRGCGLEPAREDQRLLGLIKHHWLASGTVYGYRKITLDLREAGERCSRHRVLREGLIKAR